MAGLWVPTFSDDPDARWLAGLCLPSLHERGANNNATKKVVRYEYKGK